MRACSVSEQNSHIPLDRRTFLQWLSQWWRGQHEFRVSEFQYKTEPNQQELEGLASAPKVSWPGPGTRRALKPKILPTNRNSSVVAKLCDSFSMISGGLPTQNQ